MSNHVGLIVSFIFLIVYILFSIEITNYQKAINDALIHTNQIAISIQKDGYDKTYYSDNYFYKIIIEEDNENKTYNLITYKDYDYKFNFFEYTNKDIVTKILIPIGNI